MTAKRTPLISSATLANLLGNCAIIDCRFDLSNKDWGFDQYIASHIPTAVYAHLATDLSAPLTGTNGRHPLPAIETMSATFSRFGIDHATPVVVYDQDLGMYASRLWWMLRYLGHEQVAVLDGGWARWTAEGRPVTQGEERRVPAVFVPNPQPAMLATIDDVATAGDGGRLLLDARAPERFEGRNETIDPVAGHIPGAINAFFKSNTSADGVMLPGDALNARYQTLLGTHRPDDTILYCGSGVTACHDLLAMDAAGMPGARLYVGSWSEWCADPSRPVEIGPAPRQP